MSASMLGEGAVRIVDLRPAHAEVLVPMWRESFERAVGVVDPHPIEEQRRYLTDVVAARNAVKVAMAGELVVGFIAASPVSVAQLYVRVGYQGQGLGRRLLDWAKRQSNGSLWLYTFERNACACKFYERNGFVVTARGFEPEWRLADVRYEWKLDSGPQPLAGSP